MKCRYGNYTPKALAVGAAAGGGGGGGGGDGEGTSNWIKLQSTSLPCLDVKPRPVASMLASKSTNGKPKTAMATESVWLGPGRFVSMTAGTQ